MWQRLRHWLRGAAPSANAVQAEAPGLSAARFAAVVAPMRFISELPADELARLRRISAAFLASKEFHGLLDLHVSDDMAIAIAAQACLPLLHLGPAHAPEQALRWYSGFVGIVVAPHELPVQRQWEDEAGVVHEGWDVVSGEASEDGPVMLSWHDVQVGMGVLPPYFSGELADTPKNSAVNGGDGFGADGTGGGIGVGAGLGADAGGGAGGSIGPGAGSSGVGCADAAASPQAPYNVVIHEFCHKIDMASGEADGCPPLPSGFMGHARVSDARAHWLAVLNTSFEQHAEQVEAAERFGQAAPWLDAYGAESLAEFFPVACEGYFTQRARFAQELPELLALFDALFRPHQT